MNTKTTPENAEPARELDAVLPNNQIDSELDSLGKDSVYQRPLGQRQAPLSKFYIKTSWLSAFGHLFLFVISSFLAVKFSNDFSIFVFSQTIDLGSFELEFAFPFLILVPAFILFKGYVKVNNKYAVLIGNRLWLYTGNCSLQSKTYEMEIDSMLVVQVARTPIERLLGLGTVSIGRFSVNQMEFSIRGVPHPEECLKNIKRRIQKSRKVKGK